MASFRFRVSAFSRMTQAPCSLCITIVLYDIVKRYVRYISSGGETSLIWDKAMSVKPIYFVSRTIGETSSYYNVIFLGKFSTGENTNVRTPDVFVTFALLVCLASGITFRKNNGVQAPTIFAIFDAVYSLAFLMHIYIAIWITRFTSDTFPRFALTHIFF